MINFQDLSLAQERTYFVYDLEKISENVAAIGALFPNVEQIFFSVKSNPSEIILKHLSQLGINFDVSSEIELVKAFEAAADHSRITVSGPAKNDHFIKRINKIKPRCVHIDSIEEYQLLNSDQVPFSIRWPLEDAYSQKVGVPKNDMLSIVKDCASTKRISGVHIYVGRERASVELVNKKLAEIKDFVTQHHDSFISRPNLFWGAGLPLLHRAMSSDVPDDPFFQTHLECGRALVHNAGSYVTQVLEVKNRGAEKIVIINGGLQHLASNFSSPRFGQDDVWVQPLQKTLLQKSKFNIYGSLGIPGDLLIRDVVLPKNIQRGDWLAMGPAGSYGYTAGTNQFLSPQVVTEIFINQDRTFEAAWNQPSYLEAGTYEFKNS